MDHSTKAIHTEKGRPDVGLESALRMERSVGIRVNMFLDRASLDIRSYVEKAAKNMAVSLQVTKDEQKTDRGKGRDRQDLQGVFL